MQAERARVFLAEVNYKSEVRCPKCGKLFWVGEPSSRPQERKCDRCKEIFIIWKPLTDDEVLAEVEKRGLFREVFKRHKDVLSLIDIS